MRKVTHFFSIFMLKLVKNESRIYFLLNFAPRKHIIKLFIFKTLVMKKILFVVMAVAAIGFTSCGNKTQQAEATDSVVVDTTAAGQAQAAIDQIAEVVNTKDATVLQEVLSNVKMQAANLVLDNPEAAKEYVAKVQEYLKENAEQIEAVVGENEAALTALSALTDIDAEAVVNGIQEQLKENAAEKAE